MEQKITIIVVPAYGVTLLTKKKKYRITGKRNETSLFPEFLPTPEDTSPSTKLKSTTFYSKSTTADGMKREWFWDK